MSPTDIEALPQYSRRDRDDWHHNQREKSRDMLAPLYPSGQTWNSLQNSATHGS